ncbi:Uncharacterized protein TCAP_04046 [Tolypocladium capitatum]|uniref:Uncharacterized protein n=1 Tax=Tolypocladium capitatum TaxID=45235 RepID=A0A2K3QER0_9HYPO|nr:Uncharacterized protein TCAP_04046 [Tolypocladium capitatum]
MGHTGAFSNSGVIGAGRQAAGYIAPLLLLSVPAYYLFPLVESLRAPRNLDSGNQFATEQVPGPDPAIAVGVVCLARHFVAGDDVLLPAAQQGLHPQFLVLQGRVRICPQTGAVVAIHHAQLAVQRAHQHRPPILREAQASHAHAKHIRRAPAHPHIVAPDPPVDASSHDLGPSYGQGCDGVPGVAEDLDRLKAAALGVPDAHRRVEPAADDEGVPVARKAHTVDSRRVALGVASESPRRHGRRHVPQEDGTVPARGNEALIVRCDVEAEHFVAVGGVGLDEAALGHGWLRLGADSWDGGAGEWVVQTDGAIRRSCQYVAPGRRRHVSGLDSRDASRSAGQVTADE